MALTVQVNWVGENGDTSHRPASLDLQILRSSSQYQTDTVTAEDNWYKRWEISGSRYYQYTVRVTTVTDYYTFTYKDDHQSSGWGQYNDSTVVTATYVPPPPEPQYKNVSVEVAFYNDNYDEYNKRPIYVDIALKRNGDPYQTIRLGNGWNWNWIWENLSPDYEWTVIAEGIPDYIQEVTQQEDSWRFAYRFSYVPPTPPDPSPGNHPTKEDYDLMYSVLYDDISAENAMGIIHVLDYGTFEAPDLP